MAKISSDLTRSFLTAMLVAAMTAVVSGADEAPVGASGTEPAALTKAQLASQIEKLQADARLDAAVKKDAVELLKTAVEDLDAGLEADQRRLRLQRQLETATRELETLRKKLSEVPAKAVVALPKDVDAERLERRRDELERTLEQSDHGLRERVSGLEQELNERPARLESLGPELVEAEDRLKAVREELRELPEDDGDSPVAAAHRWALRAAIQRWEQEVSALEAEQVWLESADADRWIRVLQQIAERDVARTEDELRQVEELLDAQRRREAAERVEQARQESVTVHPTLKAWTRENQELAERSRKLNERLEEIEAGRSESKDRLEALEAELEEMQQMVKNVGRNDAIGLMFRQQASRLPNPKRLRKHAQACEEEIREIKLKQFEIDRLERETPDADQVVQAAKADADRMAAEFSETELRQQAETVLAHRAELLEQLSDDYNDLFEKLVGLARVERDLLQRTLQTAKFYDEQMLWMRSGAVFGLQDLRRWDVSARWLSDQSAWRELPGLLLGDLERRPVIYLFAAIVMWGLLLPGVRRRRFDPATDPAAARQDFSLAATAAAAAATAIRAALLPAGMAFLAWRLDQSSDGSTWLQGLSNGLWRAAGWTWPLVILQHACLSEGLATIHFGWAPEAARRIARRVTWFLPPSIALMFLVGATEAARNEVITDSLGRAAFLLLMLLGGWFARGLLVLTEPAPDKAPRDIWRLRWTQFLSWAIPLAPWGLAVVAFAGYYDTALKLAWRLEATAWLWLILAGLKSAGSRWIAGEQQRLESLPDAARLGVSELRAGDKKKSLFARLRDSQASRGPSPAQIGRQILVLMQTALLVSGVACLTGIWSDVLPATEVFDRWTLWQTIATHQELEPGESGSSLRTVNRLEPVTAIDLALALMICGVTMIAGRNIPGLVEVLFLERLPLDTGGRFAVTILVRYALFVVGISLAFARINVGWSNVQWLVAAASVGLGFGLQDIFANFVSGIILLFERPIRVGDVITIGDTTGTVSQIRFRSTTIRDADRKELVVPNKDLITGKLLNWTLSDQTNRIKIRVAVSYDSDPNRVRLLLQEIAQAHPIVLKEPPPTATLEEFGAANTLVFNLRAFLPSLDDRSKVIHELHTAIHARLHADGINVPAAPQPAAPPKGVAA